MAYPSLASQAYYNLNPFDYQGTTPRGRGLDGNTDRVQAELDRQSLADEARRRLRQDPDADYYGGTGFSELDNQDSRQAQLDKFPEHDRRLEIRAYENARRGDELAQERAFENRWRADAYNAAFAPLKQETQDAYKPYIDRGDRIAAEGDRTLGLAREAYEQVLSGRAPSLAQSAITQGANQAASTGMAIANTGRGNNALARRAAIQQAALGQQNAALQAGNVRMQEQAAARGALGTMGQNRSTQGQSLALEARGEMGENMIDERNAISEEFKTDRARSDQRRDMKANQIMQGVGMGLQAAGGAAAMSDKRAKEDIKDPSLALEAFLSSLEGAGDYRYKDDSGWDDGERHVSPMAQDLEGSELGKGLIEEDEDGLKMVDYDKAQPLVLSALGLLNKRLEALEGRG